MAMQTDWCPGGLVVLAYLLLTASPATAAPAPAATKPDSAAANPAPSQNSLDSSMLGSGSGPITVTADGGLELQQQNKAYIARDNAMAKRGDRTLNADVITAYYREVPNSGQ